MPVWPSSYFWPFVNQANGAVKHFVKESFVLPQNCPVFDPGRGQLPQRSICKSVFSESPSFRVLTLRLDCA